MYGRTVLSNNSVFATRVSADGKPVYKAGGITIDWTTVVAASGDVTLTDGSVVKDGQKYLRYGQVMTKITASGQFGPYDPAVTDGRQTLTRGSCYILDETVLQYSSGSTKLSAANDIVGSAIEGGAVFIDRVLQSGVATHTLAVGPTKAEVLTAFPAIFVVQD
jgi:hypothetical protein